MNKVTDELLRLVADFKGEFTGAYNIREDGGCAGRQSTKNIKIESKTDKPGIDIRVAPGTKGEKVYIPACVTHSGVDDLVYNDFYIGEGADVVVVAGCGIHADGEEEARHNGIHRFFVGKGAKVVYEEKHVGTGASTGNRHIDPVTEAFLEEDSSLTMDTVQISGVDTTYRKTSARLAARAKAAGARALDDERRRGGQNRVYCVSGRGRLRGGSRVPLGGQGPAVRSLSPALWAPRAAQAIPNATPFWRIRPRWWPRLRWRPPTWTPRSSTRRPLAKLRANS